MKDFLKDIDWLGFCLPITILGLFLLVLVKVEGQTEIQKDIIKQSDEYIILKECTKIQGNYYCK